MGPIAGLDSVVKKKNTALADNKATITQPSNLMMPELDIQEIQYTYLLNQYMKCSLWVLAVHTSCIKKKKKKAGDPSISHCTD